MKKLILTSIIGLFISASAFAQKTHKVVMQINETEIEDYINRAIEINSLICTHSLCEKIIIFVSTP